MMVNGNHEVDMGKLIDLTGMRFGKLLVVEQAESDRIIQHGGCADVTAGISILPVAEV